MQKNKKQKKKHQEIGNAISIIKTAKEILRQMRDDKWRYLINDVFSFYNRIKIQMEDMKYAYVN